MTDTDYFRVNFESEGHRLSLDALVSSNESMTRLIELIQVCRTHMAREGGADELNARLRTLLEPQADIK